MHRFTIARDARHWRVYDSRNMVFIGAVFRTLSAARKAAKTLAH